MKKETMSLVGRIGCVERVIVEDVTPLILQLKERIEAIEEQLADKIKQSSSKKSPAPFLAALAGINEVLGTSFRPIDANRRFIEPRLKEGATVEDLVEVAKFKHRQWQDDPKMRAFLRIKTLFNAVNFESYLSEVQKAKEREAQYDELR